MDFAKAEIRDPLVRFMQADMEHLPFADNIFDVVAGTWVIECLEDPQAVVQECVRVVKPGGFVIDAFCGLFVVRYKARREYAEGRNDDEFMACRFREPQVVLKDAQRPTIGC